MNFSHVLVANELVILILYDVQTILASRGQGITSNRFNDIKKMPLDTQKYVNIQFILF
jgi:hypothetical protein